MKKYSQFIAISILLVIAGCCKDKGPNEEPTFEIISPLAGAVYAQNDTINVEAIYRDDSKFRASCNIYLRIDSLSINGTESFLDIANNAYDTDNTELYLNYKWVNNLEGQHNIKLVFAIWDFELNRSFEEIVRIKTQ